MFLLLDQKRFYQLYELLQETRKEVPLHITEGSQTILLTYLTIACQRMAAGHMLEGIQECWQDDVIVRQDQTLSDLLKRMENAFSLSITQAEASAIHIYLKGAKPRYLDKDTDFLQEDTELTGLIREMLGCFAPSVRLYLERDPEFFQALAAHLRPALVRMEHNIQVDNPFLYEVQQTYPDLYQKAVYAGQVIHQRLGYEVPDNEIGLLAVHFGGALFRYDQTYKPRRLVRIAVVCSSGIGISRLLTAQLQNAFAGKVKLCTYGEAFEDKINPSFMVTHIGGLDAAPDTILNLPKIPGGKKVIYPHLDLPLTAIDDFAERGKTDPRFARLDEICRKHRGIWCEEAEQYLLKHFQKTEE